MHAVFRMDRKLFNILFVGFAFLAGFVHSSSRPFKLGMYWERGYLWQEKKYRKDWCAQCKKRCGKGDLLYTRKCNSRSRRQYFVVVGNTLRPASRKNICVSRTGNGGKKIRLQDCDGSDTQNWEGIKFDERFELTVMNNGDVRCFSQHHHPRPKENLFMERCDYARYYDTSFWVTR